MARWGPFALHAFGTPKEKKTTLTLIKATIAIHASIMMWVGSWDLIAVEKRRDHATDDDALFRSSMVTYVIYTVFGALICIITDTLYGNAGLDAGFLHPRFSTPYAWYCFRMLIAGIGTMMLWAGLYNVIDLHAIPTAVRVQYRTEIDFALFFGGVLILVCTNTFYW